MAKRLPFTLVYAPVVAGHLNAIDAKYDSLIREKDPGAVVVRAGYGNQKPETAQTARGVPGGVGVAIWAA